MTIKPLGLYVHIPFCLRKCNYCDFCSFANVDDDVRRGYIEALVSEILSYKRCERLVVDTVFFGGGTPSVLTPTEFKTICSAINEAFEIAPDAEFSIEVNPKTLTLEKVFAYRAAGVNRVSIGLQTIHEKERIKLGRIHNFKDFEIAYGMVKEHLTDNIGVDLMYGIPYQTTASFKETLETALSFHPRHLSCYGLIIEEGTPFYCEGDKLPLPSEDEECDMYECATRILSDNGYMHYEISNYSLPGYQSRHNLKYWQLGEYIGVGVAAHSFFEGRRSFNTENISVYIRGDRKEYKVSEAVSNDELSYDFVMLGLRLGCGISLTEYKNRFFVDFLEGRNDKIRDLVKGGYAILDKDRFALTEKGLYVSNTILTELL